MVHEYNLAYKLSGASGRSLLSTVQLCGQNHQCFPATQLTWQDAGETYTTERLGYRSGSGDNYANTSQTLTPILQAKRELHEVLPKGDFNGDGVRDWPGQFISAEGESQGTFPVVDHSCGRNSFTTRPQCVELDINGDGTTDAWRNHNGRLQFALTMDAGHRYVWTDSPIRMDFF